MSTKHVRTVSDVLRFGAGIRIDCTHCGFSKSLTGRELGMLAGATSLVSLKSRLRCSRCGMKSAKLAILPPI
jgi:ribosomal protein L37E